MLRSKAFLWSSVILIFLVSSCFEEELPQEWDVYYQVVRETQDSGEYTVMYTNGIGSRQKVSELTASQWESDSFTRWAETSVSLSFERTSGTGQYRMRIYVGGSPVEEAIVADTVNSHTISYYIPEF